MFVALINEHLVINDSKIKLIDKLHDKFIFNYFFNNVIITFSITEM